MMIPPSILSYCSRLHAQTPPQSYGGGGEGILVGGGAEAIGQKLLRIAVAVGKVLNYEN